MNKLIVAVFDSESKAFEGLTAMKKLHADGSITIYATAVVAKDNNGKVEVKQEADDGPVGTAIGMLTGGLVGMVAGPAGLVLGTGIGALTGSIFDFTSLDANTDLLNSVSKELTPGKAAILVEADESWEAPVDTRLGDMGAEVFRHYKSDLVDEHFARQSDEFDAEMKELAEEMKNANDETKASIKKQMDKVKAKSKALNDSMHKKMEHDKNAMDAKLSTLKEQSAKAKEHRKEKLHKSMEKLKEANKKNKEKLQKASDKLSDYLL